MIYTFVLRFVPPDAHTPKYTLLVHNHSTTSRFPKIDTAFGRYERKYKTMKIFLEKAESTSCNYLNEAIWRGHMYEKEKDITKDSKRERVLYFSLRIPGLLD